MMKLINYRGLLKEILEYLLIINVSGFIGSVGLMKQGVSPEEFEREASSIHNTRFIYHFVEKGLLVPSRPGRELAYLIFNEDKLK